MRSLIRKDPYLAMDEGRAWDFRGIWPCCWISCPETDEPPFVTAYRKVFNLESDALIRVHVSADERYELFVDGRRIGRGSERGDQNNWFYETYDLKLHTGSHIIVARAWSLGDMAPYAQMSVRPGFILSAEGEFIHLLGTGVTQWQVKMLGGYEFVDPYPMWGRGANLIVDAAGFDWGFHTGETGGWHKAVVEHPGANAIIRNDFPRIHLMKPATLPAMVEQQCKIGTVRFVADVTSIQTDSIPVKSDDNLQSQVEQWNHHLLNHTSITIPPNTLRRVIIDLEDYYCLYPELTVSGGKGSFVRFYWAESLFESPNAYDKGKEDFRKSNRDEIEGKYFCGAGDIFKPDGGTCRTFDTLWWYAGRYIEVLVQTTDEALTIESIEFYKTGYPIKMESSFDASDPALSRVVSIALRTLQMCSHETYMDCPYYEQLMYIGDTRLQALTTYTITTDDCLPRKALQMFNASRLHCGLTQSRYPSRVTQIIPPFSLWWVGMVYDYALWRNDIEFVKRLMPAVRNVIEGYLAFTNNNGLIESPAGWNFMDWVPSWKLGVPPDGDSGVSSLLNWQMVLALRMAGELEDYFHEPELAQRCRRLAVEFTSRIYDVFWDSNRNLFADDITKQYFSEHTQSLAVLSGQLESAKREAIAISLLADQSLCRTSIYFTHYLFEAYCLLGRIEALFNRLGLWFELAKMGLKTTPEQPEPTRSDCHAWGAHVIYHYFASILGIRPGSIGFKTVVIKPQLGPLSSIRGKLIHPNGIIETDFSREDGNLTGRVSLPCGLSGTIIHNGKEYMIAKGASYSF